MRRWLIISLFVVLMAGCAAKSPESLTPRFQLLDIGELGLEGKSWRLSGRLAVKGVDNGFSASIQWEHGPIEDVIELSGPFGQGGVVITLMENRVVVDDGDKPTIYTGNAQDVFFRHFAVDMPLNALQYWVLGGAVPGPSYRLQEQGFEQLNWSLVYQRMQTYRELLLPEKIKMKNEKTTIKLVIDEWRIM